MATRDEVEAVADYFEERARQLSDSDDVFFAPEVQIAHQAADLLRQFAALLT
jgi:hypothetical protein